MATMNFSSRESIGYFCVVVVLCMQVFYFESNIIDGLSSLQGQLKSLEKAVPLTVASLYPRGKTEYEGKLERKALATILGAVVGDALGRVTEFKKDKTALESVFPSLSNITLQYSAKYHPLKHDFAQPGVIIYTDDTVMSKIVLETALEGRDNNWPNEQIVGTMASRFIPWVMEPHNAKHYGIKHLDPLHSARAHGGANQTAMLRIYQNWQKSPTGEWWDQFSAVEEVHAEGGCGSVMRAWPLGVVFYNDVARAQQLAMMQSRITHRLPMAQAACGSLAVGIAYALQNKPLYAPKDKPLEKGIVTSMIESAGACYEKALTYYEAQGKEEAQEAFSKNQPVMGSMADSSVRQNVRTLISANQLGIVDMLRYAEAAALGGDRPSVVLGVKNKHPLEIRSPSGALLGWAADEALAAALYIFIRYTDKNQIKIRKSEFQKQGRTWDEKSIVWYAIQEGVATVGDSDSIASLAGALMGAYHSTQIPKSEEDVLVSKLESFRDFVKDAHWVVNPNQTKALPELTIKVGEVIVQTDQTVLPTSPQSAFLHRITS